MYSTWYSCQILMKLEFSRQIVEKYSDFKFHKNPSIGSRVFHADGRTDMTKLIVTFRNFANAPKKTQIVKIFLIIFISNIITQRPISCKLKT